MLGIFLPGWGIVRYFSYHTTTKVCLLFIHVSVLDIASKAVKVTEQYLCDAGNSPVSFDTKINPIVHWEVNQNIYFIRVPSISSGPSERPHRKWDEKPRWPHPTLKNCNFCHSAYKKGGKLSGHSAYISASISTKKYAIWFVHSTECRVTNTSM